MGISLSKGGNVSLSKNRSHSKKCDRWAWGGMQDPPKVRILIWMPALLWLRKMAKSGPTVISFSTTRLNRPVVQSSIPAIIAPAQVMVMTNRLLFCLIRCQLIFNGLFFVSPFTTLRCANKILARSITLMSES